MCEMLLYKLSLSITDRGRQSSCSRLLLSQEKQTAAAGERKDRRKVPEAGKVDPEESRLSGGGGAGRFGRVRVCGTTAAARKERKSRAEEKKSTVEEEEM